MNDEDIAELRRLLKTGRAVLMRAPEAPPEPEPPTPPPAAEEKP